jgi:hypothetical protein
LLRTLAFVLGAALAAGAIAQHRAEPLGSETIHIDGRLDEPVWRRTPVFDRFRQIDPYTGEPARYRTAVQVAYDRAALYFAIRAYDPEPSSIRAPRTRYDKVLRDQDFVVVYIDGVGTRASAQWFRLGAGGGMADGVHTAATDNEDFSPDFEWEGAARIVEDGYTLELRIPFSTLRFAHHGTAPWRVQVARRVPREQRYLFIDAAFTLESPSFISEMPELEGFPQPSTEFFWQARPTLTARRSSERSDSGSAKRSDLEAGLDLKVRPRADWVIDATLNPDFSQIELDVPQLARNQQFALFLQEKRPFFLEGSDLAQTPSDSSERLGVFTLYSRSITDPRWGVRATFRCDELAGTALSVSDRGGGLVLLPSPFATGTARQPPSQATTARARWDHGDLSIGALVSDRSYRGAGYNRLAGPDAVWRIDPAQFLRAQALVSSTSAFADASGTLREEKARGGHFVNLEWIRNSDVSAMKLRYREASEDFRNDNGFFGQNGFRRISGRINRQFRPQHLFFHEISPSLEVLQTRTQRGSAVIGEEIRPGLSLYGPRGMELELQWRPRERAQVDAAGPLHEYRQWFLSLTLLPSPVFTTVTAELTGGERVDVLANRVRPGRVLSLSGRIRPARSLEIEPSFNQGILEADNGRRAQTETTAQWLSVLHLSARDSLRLVVQRVSFTLTEDAGPPITPGTDRMTTGSVVYTHRRTALTVFYLGVTRAERRQLGARNDTTEFFAKAQFDF